mgnify:CR=1 FL=1
MFTQVFLSVYLIIYFATAFFWRSYRTWKATGQNPYTLGSSDNAYDYVGVFRLSRNPIFLGMRLTLLGLFLVIPNAVTLAVLVLGNVLVQVQVRLEEAFGEVYARYREQVRRWI